MTELIACLSIGKGTWMPVIQLINDQEWDQIFLVCTDFARQKFNPTKQVQFIVIDPRKSPRQMVKDIVMQLGPKIKGTQVALNLTSGTGNEHMAILSALLKLGLGIRLFHVSEKGLEEI